MEGYVTLAKKEFLQSLPRSGLVLLPVIVNHQRYIGANICWCYRQIALLDRLDFGKEG
jgi:hypothetical protein